MFERRKNVYAATSDVAKGGSHLVNKISNTNVGIFVKTEFIPLLHVVFTCQWLVAVMLIIGALNNAHNLLY